MIGGIVFFIRDTLTKARHPHEGTRPPGQRALKRQSVGQIRSYLCLISTDEVLPVDESFAAHGQPV
jgi:hypothetical protein